MTTETAILAGGCFWCLQPPLDSIDGVTSTRTGYCGGPDANPTYNDICTGTSGHYEAVEINFDPSRCSYESLLAVFWRQIDPSDDGGQFADRGPQYRSAIFVTSDQQRDIATASRQQLEQDGPFARVVTEILDAVPFYPAEEHHQNYSIKCPLKYSQYKEGSGRGPFLRETWTDTNKGLEA